MFSFHKPKVYRSTTGCCICKAKSSSSRFTDSKKYEEDFFKCFQLEEKRSGEICNACVLLVKRWKKLPVGSSRNWRHVVDARAGPGIKSLTKFKSRNKKKIVKDDLEKLDKIPKKKHVYAKNNKDRESSPAMSDDMTDGTGSKNSSRAGSPENSDDADGEKRLDLNLEISSFIDLTYFKMKRVCCGMIFVGMMGEVLIEPNYFKPCLGCTSRRQQSVETVQSNLNLASPAHSSSSSTASSPSHSSASTSPPYSNDSCNEGGKTKAFCDSSSDSGYDDISSGGGLNEIKKQSHFTTPQAVNLLVKPAIKPAIHKNLPVATTVRLTTANGTKLPIKLLCKPVSFVNSTHNDSIMSVPKAVDFSVRQNNRQSLAN